MPEIKITIAVPIEAAEAMEPLYQMLAEALRLGLPLPRVALAKPDDDADAAAEVNGVDKTAAPASSTAAPRVRVRPSRAKTPATTTAVPDNKVDDPIEALGVGGAASGGDPFDDPLPEDEPAPMDAKANGGAKKTPAECQASGLAILRQVYGTPGGADHVKALQKVEKVSKFGDVTLDRWPAIHAKALALAKQMKIDVSGL